MIFLVNELVSREGRVGKNAVKGICKGHQWEPGCLVFVQVIKAIRVESGIETGNKFNITIGFLRWSGFEEGNAREFLRGVSRLLSVNVDRAQIVVNR